MEEGFQMFIHGKESNERILTGTNFNRVETLTTTEQQSIDLCYCRMSEPAGHYVTDK